MPFCPSLMLLIITIILPTRSAMLISPANTRGSTVAWSIRRAAPEQEPAHLLPSNYLLASPGERIPVPSQRAGILRDANPGRCWLASVWSGTAVRASTSPREKREVCFGKSQCSQVVAAVTLARFPSYMAAMASDPLGGRLAKEEKL